MKPIRVTWDAMPEPKVTRPMLSLALLVLAAGAAAPAARAADLAPRQGWRIRVDPGRVAASVDAPGAARIPGLAGDAGGAPWPAAAGAAAARGEVWVAFELPEPRAAAVLLVVEVEVEGDTPVPVALHGVGKGGKLDEVERRALGPNRKNKRRGPRIAHLTVPAGKHRGVRVALGAEGAPAPRIERLRAYALDPRGRDDYWLFLGASLTTGAIDPDAFAAEVARRYPGYDPYCANEAVSGGTAGSLRKALPEILAEHPHARYVAIHIGGNDVSGQRPYPGGADRLRADIEAILRAIREAGKVPILARLTYRSYKASGGKPGVPPEENGSGPYNTAVHDPLIREHCPDFFDRKTGRGVVDLYAWFRDHQDEIGGDGIHLTAAGSKSFRRLFVELAGGVVYGR